MQIKVKQSSENRKFDASEWNDELDVFFRTPLGVEQLIFNDLFIEYRNADLPVEERFNAAFRAAKMCLVDQDGVEILNDADAETLT